MVHERSGLPYNPTEAAKVEERYVSKHDQAILAIWAEQDAQEATLLEVQARGQADIEAGFEEWEEARKNYERGFRLATGR